MNSKEKKFLLIGLGSGLVLAVLLIGAITTASRQSHADTSHMAEMKSNSSINSSPEAATEAVAETPGATIELSDAEQQAAGVQLAAVRRQNVANKIDAFGRVEEPEAQLRNISARIAGRIDKLYVQFTGQPIRVGQPIADIYSPDVSATAEEYRLAVDSRKRLGPGAQPDAISQAEDLIAACRRRLELWGITSQQIDRLTTGDPKLHVTIFAPFGGTITERKVTSGQYVNSGDTMYTVADLSEVWIKADVYEADLPQVHVGQAVEITTDSLPGERIHGKAEFLEPSANPQTRTVAVHVHVANPGMRLRPGMYVRSVFFTSNANLLVVPRSAVLDTGARKLVYVAGGNGSFTARSVELGLATTDFYPVLSGLKEGEQVVASGNFLVDSQTRLSAGMSSLYGGSKEYSKDSSGKKAESVPTPAVANFKLNFLSPDPIKGAAPNSFRATLLDNSGKPVADANIHVTFVMPAMPSMGMPEMRSSGELKWSGRDYAGDLNIPMGGSWNTSVEATRQGQTLATQHLRLNAQ